MLLEPSGSTRSRVQIWPVALGLIAAVACGERPPAASPAPALEIATPETLAKTEDPRAVAAPAPHGPSFAASPLTPFANQLTELVGAVIDGRSPPGGIPLAPWQDAAQLVKSRVKAPTPRRGDLEFIVFGMELSLMLSDEPRVPGAAPGTTEPGKLEMILFLSSAGSKLAKLNLREPSRAYPLPRWLGAVELTGTGIFDAARRGALDSLLIGEPERGVLKNDSLFEQLLKDRPNQEVIALAQDLARRKSRPIGWRVDDLYLVARDRAGGIWGFKLEIEEHEGQLLLETDPLIEVSRPEPEQLR